MTPRLECLLAATTVAAAVCACGNGGSGQFQGTVLGRGLTVVDARVERVMNPTYTGTGYVPRFSNLSIEISDRADDCSLSAYQRRNTATLVLTVWNAQADGGFQEVEAGEYRAPADYNARFGAGHLAYAEYVLTNSTCIFAGPYSVDDGAAHKQLVGTVTVTEVVPGEASQVSGTFDLVDPGSPIAPSTGERVTGSFVALPCTQARMPGAPYGYRYANNVCR